jgi:alkylation response protein AidB-like acyl-CoA dehydrogenase
VDFTLSDEEAMLHESVSRFVASEYELTRRQKLIDSDADHWGRFAELGWLGVGIPEAAGGYSESLAGAMIVSEILGGGLALEPYVGIAVLTPQVVLSALGAEASAPLLAPVAEGASLIALANAEHEAGANLCFVETSARRAGGGYVLSGAKTAIIGGPKATSFLIATRTSGDVGDSTGISLFHAPRHTPGLCVRDYRMIDASPMSDIKLDNVELPVSALLGKKDHALGALQAGVDAATVATVFGVVGAMSAALALTTEHLKTRKQFGGPLRDFQVLRHRAADMLIAIEQARSAAYRALAALSQRDPDVRARAVSAAKVVLAQSSAFVGQNAIQLHGGMGVVDEFRISHLFKYMAVANSLFGADTHHIKRLGALL